MSIKKFKSFEEMEPSCWIENNGPKLLRCIASLWHFAYITTRPHWTPGVYRYRSIEEAANSKNHPH